jgi:large subunit ribosomal protein L30
MGKKKAETEKKLRIRQIGSKIGGTQRQRAILRSLGLRKMNQEVLHKDNPAIRGMIRSIPHLVKVVEE